VQLNPASRPERTLRPPLIALAALALLLPRPRGRRRRPPARSPAACSPATGEPVAGASVSATNVETGFVRGTLSRPDGTFNILLLPPGTYTVRASSIGYQPGADHAAPRGRRAAAPRPTSSCRSARCRSRGSRSSPRPADQRHRRLGRLGRRPGGDREPPLARPRLHRLHRARGRRLAQPGDDHRRPVRHRGQRPSQTNLQIDGVDANNSFFGENRGGSRIPFNFSLESIREFQVVTNGYDVEYGRYSGGVVNVITRGGTNRFEGTVFGNLRNEQLTGPYFTPIVVQGDTIRRPREYEVMQYGTRLSGPIITDRLHYLVSLDGQRRREPFTPLTAGALPRSRRHRQLRGDEPLPQHPAEPVRRRQRAGAVPSVQHVERRHHPLRALDYTINDAHRLSLRHNFATYENDNETFGDSFRGGLSTVETIENALELAGRRAAVGAGAEHLQRLPLPVLVREAGRAPRPSSGPS
jgi:hypothetical protein